MKITILGYSGSGKSTIARKLVGICNDFVLPPVALSMTLSDVSIIEDLRLIW